MKPVTIVGAGFSGLTLAHALTERGIPVQIFERSSNPGGLISTQLAAHGMVETAANALLANESLEQLFARLGVELAPRLRQRKNRYIFWQRPRRWPLGFLTTLKLIAFAFKLLMKRGSVRPRDHESIREWACRAVGFEFSEQLLEPALQGIYAGQPERMSARLILARLFNRAKRARRGRLRGSVSPVGGMGELVNSLAQSLQRAGVAIQYGRVYHLPSRLDSPVVLCTSAWACAEILRPTHSELAQVLERCESLPIVTVTAFFQKSKRDLQGFGCLFPRSQGFYALGVLFNDCIFAGRSSVRSETWILGGSARPEVLQLSDAEILEKICLDRRRMGQGEGDILEVRVTRWPRALPHYTTDWARELDQLSVPRPLFLHGNYLGGLGLSQIHQRSRALALEIEELYGS